MSRPASVAAVLAMAIGPVVLPGCSEGGGSSHPDPLQVRQIPEGLRDDLQPVVEANTAFALFLYGKLTEPGKNMFFSPYSVSTALAMMWAGAGGTTEEEMARTLRFTLPPERIHPIFGALQESLDTGSGLGGYRLDIANRLWGQIGFPWLPSFLDRLRTEYAADLQDLDFVRDPETCRGTINRWVADETEGKIQDLLPPGSVDEMTRLVVTDAIYFKGRWEHPFDPARTQDRKFTLLSGEEIEVPTMEGEGSFGCADVDGISVLVLPYSGRDLSMVVLLPDRIDGLADLEGRLTPANLSAWLGAAATISVEVTIPPFRTSSKFDLAPILAANGMPSAFSVEAADFSGIDGARDLSISVLWHQSWVQVDEEGTEAAAATGGGLGTTSLPRSFAADHPFLFLIRDEVTGSVLFLGRIVDPR